MRVLNANVFTTCIFLCTNLFLLGCTKEAIQAESIPIVSITAATNDMAAAPAATIFGAYISGSTDVGAKEIVCDALGVQYVRYSIRLKNFSGTDKGYERWVNDGYKVLLNLNYDNSTHGPVPFPTNMAEYRRLLEKVLQKYHPEIAVIENEPTTDQFHKGPIENYINMLKVAADVCSKYGVKVADGALHVDWVRLVMNGIAKEGNALETKKLINAYKTIALDYVNTHVASPFAGSSTTKYPAGYLENIANYLRTQTGKPVICNEYNQQNTSATLMAGTISGFEAGNYKYMIARSGSGDDKGAALNNGTKLTPLGIAYRNAIR